MSCAWDGENGKVSMAPVDDSLPAAAYEQLWPIPFGRTREEVAKHQRARLFAAMIELLPERGYTATTVRQLCAYAGVGQDTLYRHFGSKENYFLATFGLIVRRAADRVNAAYRSRCLWTEQIEHGFDAFINEVVNEPKAARLALVEVLGVGPKALEAMTSAHAVFERMVGSTFQASPEPVEVPPIVLKAIVGGIARVVRQRLLDGQVSHLRGESDELLRWLVAYHSNAARMLPPAAPAPPCVTTPRLPTSGAGTADEGERLMRAAALMAVRHGYTNLSAAKIIQAASVPDDAFFDRFPGHIEECFMAAYDLLGGEVAAYAAEAAASETAWPRAVRAGLAALMWRIASDEVFAQTAFVQVFSVGPAAVTSRSQLMTSFRDLLLGQSPVEARPSELVADAIVGAIWQIVHHYVVRGAARQLPTLTDLATYLVLVPALGGEHAMNEIRDAQAASPAV